MLLRELQTSKAPRECGRHPVPSDDAPELRLAYRGTRAWIAGLLTCGATNRCPYCRQREGAERSQEINAIVAEVRAHGWRDEFGTFTIRHDSGLPLRTSLAVLADAYARLVRGAPWQRLERLAGGSIESIRSLEINWNGRHGWHPHLHALYLSPRGIGPERGWVRARWIECVERAALAHGIDPERVRPHDIKGADIQRVRKSEKAASYVLKSGIGAELAGDLTKAAETGRFTVWSLAALLDHEQRARVPWAPSVERVRELLTEYMHAIHGKAWIRASKGLRDALPGIGEDVERVDDERGARGDLGRVEMELWKVVRARESVALAWLDRMAAELAEHGAAAARLAGACLLYDELGRSDAATLAVLARELASAIEVHEIAHAQAEEAARRAALPPSHWLAVAESLRAS